MKYHAPLDPDCPDAQKEVFQRIEDMNNDPMTAAMGAPVDEFQEDWENKHRCKCKRCQQYGAANIEVV